MYHKDYSADKLHLKVIEAMKYWMMHHKQHIPWFLENEQVRPLEQTITMCFTCLDLGTLKSKESEQRDMK